MMEQAPKISVIMGVRNERKHVEKAVESILNQTCGDFELIIVDDNSTDGTSEILSGYTDARIKIFRQNENSGLTVCLNKALPLSSSGYIARMDSDDVSFPERLQIQKDFLDSNPGVQAVGAAFVLIDENDGEVSVRIPPLEHSEIIKCLENRVNPFCHGSMMFRRSFIEKSGGYRNLFRYAQDYDLWLRTAEKCEMINLKNILYKHRDNLLKLDLHSYIEKRKYCMLAEICADERKRDGREPTISEISGNFTSRWHRRNSSVFFKLRGLEYLRIGKISSARQSFLNALKYSPRDLGIWFYYLVGALGYKRLQVIKNFLRHMIKKADILSGKRCAEYSA